VITANDGIRSAVVARGTPAVRVTSVYNALETVPQVPAAELVRKTYGLPAGRLLVHAGGINRERDLETLFRATALLPETLSCGIVLVGEGEPAYVASLRTLAHSLGIADRTWFLGRLPISAARDLSSLSEVGVVTLQSNPLTRLAWPNRIAEFVAFRRNLVLPDLPFLRSVMGDSARYYVPGNPASLAQELEATMLDAPRESLGSALGERAARALDWPSMRREYLGICARLTGT
jgi:glycosyltransferase involved in cell wall biosynthesis